VLGIGLHVLWGSDAHNIFALTGACPHGTDCPTTTQIAHFDGTQWRLMPSGVSAMQFYSLWGVSATSVYASGGIVGGSDVVPTVVHYDGTEWRSMNVDTAVAFINGPGIIRGFWGTSDANLYAVGGSSIVHYNGTTWTILFDGVVAGGLRSVWGASDTTVFMAGGECYLVRYNGTGFFGSWYPASRDCGQLSDLRFGGYVALNAIWGASDTDVFVVGGNGIIGFIAHYDGSLWTTMPSGTTQHLRAVWGTSPSNVIAVGDSGTIVHYDGKTWSPMESGTTDQLTGVWASAPNHFVVTAASGLILRSH